MKIVYEFHGGLLNKKRLTSDFMDVIRSGYTANLSSLREMGILCHRAELDDQPTVDGYLGPMWDGLRYVDENGKEYHDWNLTDDQKQSMECFAVLRYETQEVYDRLSQ